MQCSVQPERSKLVFKFSSNRGPVLAAFADKLSNWHHFVSLINHVHYDKKTANRRPYNDIFSPDRGCNDDIEHDDAGVA